MRLFRIKGVAVKLNDTMKKVHKSKMIEKLHTEPMKAFPDKYIALVDSGDTLVKNFLFILENFLLIERQDKARETYCTMCT